MTRQGAEVVVERSVRALDRPFSYWVPEDLECRVGHLVEVPLGRGRAIGVVTALWGEEDRPPAAPSLKTITRLLDPEPVLTPSLLELAQWMTRNYRCFLPQALRAMVPAGVRRSEPLGEARPHRGLLWPIEPPPRGAALIRAYQFVAAHPGAPWAAVQQEAGVSSQQLKTLTARGHLAERAADELPAPSEPNPTLNAEQHAALEEILGHQVTLLEGVTGSGKTEVYLEAMALALEEGREGLLVVPEIALTPQTLARIQRRFGSRVRAWHSRLTDRERMETWHAVRAGQVPVVIGARSAVFLPFPKLGIVVIDEEHEPSYKQDDHPRYHARDVALKRAELEGAKVILGSATPSLEAGFWARSGRAGWGRLSGRFGGAALPRVSVVDMRDELAANHRLMFSRELLAAVSERLSRREQVVLFLNRRGYAASVLCRGCGQALQCPRCSVALTYHQRENRMRCHYCFYETAVPARCPGCGSAQIRQFGVGTEKVVEEVMRLWPSARVLRADRDTMGSAQSYHALYHAFLHGEADILVGTQMIAKGLDWPGVTLVGILAADLALHLPDFRAAERTFQLLVQAGGRAGRRTAPGAVVIQTYNPEHYAIEAAAEHSYARFYAVEMGFREALGYPPFGKLCLIETKGPDKTRVHEVAIGVHGEIQRQAPHVEIMGPAPAPLYRLRGVFREHLLVRWRGDTEEVFSWTPGADYGLGVQVTCTVDPYHML